MKIQNSIRMTTVYLRSCVVVQDRKTILRPLHFTVIANRREGSGIGRSCGTTLLAYRLVNPPWMFYSSTDRKPLMTRFYMQAKWNRLVHRITLASFIFISGVVAVRRPFVFESSWRNQLSTRRNHLSTRLNHLSTRLNHLSTWQNHLSTRQNTHRARCEETDWLDTLE